eukprot:1572468-Prymnesium_polylepis.1
MLRVRRFSSLYRHYHHAPDPHALHNSFVPPAWPGDRCLPVLFLPGRRVSSAGPYVQLPPRDCPARHRGQELHAGPRDRRHMDRLVSSTAPITLSL